MSDGVAETGPEQFDPYAAPPASHGSRPGALPAAVVAAVVATVALLLVGTAAVLAAVVAGGGNNPPVDRSVAASAPTTSAPPSAFTRGTCFDEDRSDAAADEAGELIEKPCSGAHDYRVYFAFVLDEEPWPGEAFVDEESERRCTNALRADDPDFGEFSEDDLQWYQPSEDTWSLGDRDVTCFVADSPEAFLQS